MCVIVNKGLFYRSYEVDPSRVEVGDNLNQNIQNLMGLTDRAFEMIVNSYQT